MTNRMLRLTTKSIIILYGTFLGFLTYSKKYSFEFWDESLIKIHIYIGNGINLFIIFFLLLLSFLNMQKKIILVLTIVCSVWIGLQLINELIFFYHTKMSGYLLRTFLNFIVLFTLILNQYLSKNLGNPNV